MDLAVPPREELALGLHPHHGCGRRRPRHGRVVQQAATALGHRRVRDPVHPQPTGPSSPPGPRSADHVLRHGELLPARHRTRTADGRAAAGDLLRPAPDEHDLGGLVAVGAVLLRLLHHADRARHRRARQVPLGGAGAVDVFLPDLHQGPVQRPARGRHPVVGHRRAAQARLGLQLHDSADPHLRDPRHRAGHLGLARRHTGLPQHRHPVARGQRGRAGRLPEHRHPGGARGARRGQGASAPCHRIGRRSVHRADARARQGRHRACPGIDHGRGGRGLVVPRAGRVPGRVHAMGGESGNEAPTGSRSRSTIPPHRRTDPGRATRDAEAAQQTGHDKPQEYSPRRGN